ncbi:MAG: phenylacetate--CoA ligase [Deltaproteobacteria bacterium]|nr:phenylacetate--CoA ligase [Deltaproteobacteria bacterium]
MTNMEADMEYQPYEEVIELQTTKLRELMAGPWQKAPGFVRRLEDAGLTTDDLTEPGNILKFPVLKKSDFPSIQAAVPPFGGMIAVSPGELRRIYSSPGPIYDPDGRLASYYRWERAFAACGFSEGDIVLNCFSYHLTPAGAMFEEGANNLGCAVIPAGIGNSEIQVSVAAHLKANAYVGLPSYLKVLLEKAEETGLSLPFEKAFVIAEKLSESLRTEFQEKNGIHVRQGYGTAEVGAIAYECEEGSGMHLDPTVLVEVLDPETHIPVPAGTPGEVVVTPFNPINALLRFATGDLSSVTLKPCPCGRKSPRLTGILGRVDQVTKVRGLFVYPGQLAEALSGFEEIERFRAVIVRERAMDDMTVEVETRMPLPAHTLEKVGGRLKEVLKLGVRVVRVEPGTIQDDARAIDDRRKWD